MGEYGRVVSQGSGTGGGLDRGGDVTEIVTDIVARIAAQPPEILLAIAAIIIVGGWLILRR
jgi:hypothetical protein